jgi:short-subunit dehydrogenase
VLCATVYQRGSGAWQRVRDVSAGASHAAPNGIVIVNNLASENDSTSVNAATPDTRKTTPKRAHSCIAWKDPSTVLITGATGGIGAALARSYAAPGRTLILHGRNRPKLAEISGACEALGARVVQLTFDLQDAPNAIRELRLVSEHETIDLVVVNAGVTRMIGGGEAVESWEAVRAVLGVNIDGALATVAAVLPAMRRRQSGQIALVSSLAAYFGLPQAPTYSASKAALKAYGEALRAWLAPQGIAVNVVLAGFVQTPMTEGFIGPKPATIPAESAALQIRKGLARNRARIAFPRPLAWGMSWLSVLPQSLSHRIMGALGYRA